MDDDVTFGIAAFGMGVVVVTAAAAMAGVASNAGGPVIAAGLGSGIPVMLDSRSACDT